MLRNREMMLAMLLGGELKMASGLAGDGVAEFAERLSEVASR
jgi:hypothetical protein